MLKELCVYQNHKIVNLSEERSLSNFRRYMYVLIGSQFGYITVRHLEIQPDPVSQRHFQSPTCRFSKNLDNLDNLSPTYTQPSRAFKTQTRRKAVYQSITEAAPRKRVFSRGNALYAAPSKIVQSRVGQEKGIEEAKIVYCMVKYSASTS